MTKLAIMSDLHIDLNQFGDFETETLIKTLTKEGITHLHLAGDLANHFSLDALPFLKDLEEHFFVTYNLGNHDMLDLTEEQIEELDFQLHTIGDKKLLAFHGWYDYSYSDDELEKILRRKRQLWFDRRLKRSASDPDLCLASLQSLEKVLRTMDTSKLIVAMHFVPHQAFTMTHERFAPFNAFLGSQAYHDLFVKYGVKDVVFGHAHRTYGTVTIDGVRYHSRPLGYRREWDLTIDFVSKHPEYNPTGTWNLSKRYNLVKKRPDFQEHVKKELANEFLQSMSIFDL